MKLSKSLILASGLIVATSSQADVLVDSSVVIDWDSLTFTPSSGVTLTKTPITFDSETFESSEDAWVEAGYPAYYSNKINSIDGADISVPYSETSAGGTMNLDGGFSSSQNSTYGVAELTNTAGATPYQQSGFTGAYRNQFYLAEGNGSVTFAIDYQIMGDVSVSEFGDAGWVGFEFLWEAFNVTDFLAGGDGSVEFVPYFNGVESPGVDGEGIPVGLYNEEFLNVYYGCLIGDCATTVDETGPLSIMFNVADGKVYGFGAEGSTWVGTSVVPVPAAVWLFGSGLIGLVGVARRKKS